MISSTTRRCVRAPLARTIARSARAIRPWRPITLPTSSGRDSQLEHGRAFLPHFLDLDRVGIVDEPAREVGEQLSHRRSPS